MALKRGTGGVADRPQRGFSYGLSLGLVVALLALVTGTFVLIVLPQRFILHAGLREAGYNFPSAPVGFTPVQAVAVTPVPSAEFAAPKGPAEAFWDDVGPLLESGHYERALPLFERYLGAHPRDWDVWREYAFTLAAAGRSERAAAALERYASATRDFTARLQLARLLRDLGRLDRAFALYHGLVAERPRDVALRAELAGALAWAGRYDEAIAQFRRILEADPDATEQVLALARVFYWSGRLPQALDALARIPATAPEAAEAARLRATIEAQLSAPEVVVQADDTSALDRARAAGAAGDVAGAARLYRELLAREPRSPDLWLEWADLLEHGLDDPAGARAALERSLELRPDDVEAALRLARLHLWAGNTAAAQRWLEVVRRRDPASAEAWRLQGDLERWTGDRVAAARAYREALRRDPDDEAAAAGLDAVSALTEETIARWDRGGVTSDATYFGDTDGFRRWVLGGAWTGRRTRSVVSMRAGAQRLEGPDVATSRGTTGAYAELEVARWWREATVRTAVRAGVERLDATGTEPRAGVRVELPELQPFALTVEYDHGPAHPFTVTLGSAVAPVTADRVAVSLFGPAGGGWSVWGSGEGTALHGDGTDNVRFSGAVALLRELAPTVRGGVTSGVMGYRAAAPRAAERSLYWDPELSWANGVFVEVATPPGHGWEYRARVAPAVALVREREAGALQGVPQLTSELGIGYAWPRAALRSDGFYLLGRDGAYSAYGVTLRLTLTR